MHIPVTVYVATAYGQDVFLTGSFCDWSVDQHSLPLHYDQHYKWKGLVNLKTKQPFEYKYFIKDNDNRITWQGGSNMRFDPATQREIVDSWETPKQFKVPDIPVETTDSAAGISGFESDVETIEEDQTVSSPTSYVKPLSSGQISDERRASTDHSRVLYVERIKEERFRMEEEDEDASMTEGHDDDTYSPPTPHWDEDHPLDVSPVEVRNEEEQSRGLLSNIWRTMDRGMESGSGSYYWLIPPAVVVLISIILKFSQNSDSLA
ncbi:hypothetical protein P9112_004241 [Eukaryota sp. TZLM1-RC]